MDPNRPEAKLGVRSLDLEYAWLPASDPEGGQLGQNEHAAF